MNLVVFLIAHAWTRAALLPYRFLARDFAKAKESGQGISMGAFVLIHSHLVIFPLIVWMARWSETPFLVLVVGMFWGVGNGFFLGALLAHTSRVGGREKEDNHSQVKKPRPKFWILYVLFMAGYAGAGLYLAGNTWFFLGFEAVIILPSCVMGSLFTIWLEDALDKDSVMVPDPNQA